MHVSFSKAIQILLSFALSVINLAIVMTTVRSTVDRTTFSLVITLAAICATTLASLWRHAVAGKATA